MSHYLFVIGVALLVSCSDSPGPVGRNAEALDQVVLPDDELPAGVLAAVAVEATIVRPDLPADDLDGDGFGVEVDPDDDNPFAYPGADEIRCNDVDEDGDGTDLCPPDADGDGFAADLDCDDLDAMRSPWTPEIGCDGLDQNCDGLDYCDRDEDGVDDAYDLDPADPARRTARDEEPQELLQ